MPSGSGVLFNKLKPLLVYFLGSIPALHSKLSLDTHQPPVSSPHHLPPQEAVSRLYNPRYGSSQDDDLPQLHSRTSTSGDQTVKENVEKYFILESVGI